MPSDKQIYFLTALGDTAYSRVQYSFGSRTHTTCFAPAATAALVFDPSERRRMNVRILCTKRARDKWFDHLAGEFNGLGVSGVDWREVPEVRSQSEIQEVLTAILDVVPDKTAVAVDVTLGFRHLPFIYVAGLTYLTGLRDIEFKGMFYAAKSSEHANCPCTIVDLSPFFELIQWYQAMAALRSTGRARPLAKVLRKHVAALFSQRPHTKEASRHISIVRDAAEKLAAPLACGLPVEAGLAAGKLLLAMQRTTVVGADTALLSAQQLANVVGAWALPAEIEEKGKLDLTKEELERQWKFACWLLEHDDYANCLEVLREWVVNVILYRQGVTGDWLNYERYRKPAEHFLAALAYRARARLGLETETHEKLASLWSEISEKRNALAHAGMRPEVVKLSHDELERLLRKTAGKLIEQLEAVHVRFSGTEKLLVSGLGRSPGALFTALSHVRPEAAVLLTSEEARTRLQETLDAAGSPNLKVHLEILEDPYRAFREASRITVKYRPVLLSASLVVVNLTGGTTAMQYLAERLADEARRLGVPAQRVAVLDPRPSSEQQARPFELGAFEVLDKVVPEPGAT